MNVTTACALCGTQCIPMADYELPVCVRCDDDHEQVLARLQPMPPATRWISRGIFGAEAVALAKTLVRPDVAPGRPEDIAELMDAFPAQGRAAS